MWEAACRQTIKEIDDCWNGPLELSENTKRDLKQQLITIYGISRMAGDEVIAQRAKDVIEKRFKQ